MENQEPILKKERVATVNGKDYKVIGGVFKHPVKKSHDGQLFFTMFAIINVTENKLHEKFYISQPLTEKELDLNVQQASENIKPHEPTSL